LFFKTAAIDLSGKTGGLTVFPRAGFKPQRVLRPVQLGGLKIQWSPRTVNKAEEC
jgi:hypothetical protein